MRFSRKGFKAFLESKKPRQSVGDPHHSDKCPLCKYLQAQGAHGARMGIFHRTMGSTTIGRENPAWARQFQLNAMKHTAPLKRSSMSAAAALKVLENV